MRLPTLLGKGTQPSHSLHYMWEARSEGLWFRAHDHESSKFPHLSRSLKSPDAQALLEQLVGDDLAVAEDGRYLSAWPSVYALLRSRLYAASIDTLELPAEGEFIPKLQSRGSLTDSHFAIQVSGWVKPDGTPMSLETLVGGMVRSGGKVGLLSPPVWRLMDAIARFATRPSEEHNEAATRRSWGMVRSLALEAGARLDDFLVRSVVVTPEKLDIDFRRTAVAGTTVVEIAPSFQGAPERWLEYFDKESGVPETFNIPTATGVVHVALSEPVRSVLREIKRLPGRRAAGPRAEAFLLNPVAALGSDAAATIDIEQFETAKSQAGINFERFRPFIEKDALGHPQQIGLEIDGADKTTTRHPFKSDEEASGFVAELRKRLRNNLQILAWNDYEFELDGDAARYLAEIEAALTERAKPPIVVRHDRIFDLTNYSERVSGIGPNEEFLSVYIVKKSDEEGWFASNLMPVLKTCGGAEKGNDIGVAIAPEDLPSLSQAISEAKKRGENEILVPGFSDPLPIESVEKAVQAITDALAARPSGVSTTAPETIVAAKDRPTLLIKGNIGVIEHV